ncbi:GNAT family N-acetyltransferase [Candidatus Soleaferrea massiliensis]|uniref:GNAT family N-acetyltransferase n=1 Tax=Candidatus Soleaferrea massiliensis TaxID=1470354 RepID=UPI0006947752|nr:GNAT family N-acetyltransferase [Candidatus Soleaferrea massiliensis]
MRDQIQVRFIENESELKSCLGIRQKVFVEEQHTDPAEEFDELDHLLPHTHILLLYDGQPAGTARLKRLGDEHVKYQRIAILQEFRGKHLGAELLCGLDRLAKALRYRHVTIGAQKYAEGFYTKCGFVTTDPTIFLDAGIEHIMMEKSL